MTTSAVARDQDGTQEEFLQQLAQGGELLGAGHSAEALAHLEAAHALQPKNEKAQNLLGLCCFKLGLLDRAAEIYELLVRENPVDATLRVNLGLVYLKGGSLQRAVREFETATDLAPEHRKAHNYLGLALAQAGEYGRAREHFVQAGSEHMAEKMARALDGGGFAPLTTPVPGSAAVRGAPRTVEAATEAEAGSQGLTRRSDLPGSTPAAQARSSQGDAEAPSPEAFEITDTAAEEVSRPAPRIAGGRAPDSSAPRLEDSWGAQFGLESTEDPAQDEASQGWEDEADSGVSAVPPAHKAQEEQDDAGSRESASPAAHEAPEQEDPAEELVVELHADEESESGAHVLPEDELDFGTDDDHEGAAPGADPSASPSSAAAEDHWAAFDEPEVQHPAPTPIVPPVTAQPVAAKAVDEGRAAAASAPDGAWDGELGSAARSGGFASTARAKVPLTGTWLAETARALVLGAQAGDRTFSVAADGVASIRISGGLRTRTHGLLALEGELGLTPEPRRRRGRAAGQMFGPPGRELMRARGQGVLHVRVPERRLLPLELGEESVYLREQVVYAFEEPVMFENGSLSDGDAGELLLVHLRGAGRVLLELEGTLRSVTLREEAPTYVELSRLVGWLGEVTPKLLQAGTGIAARVELVGSGFALLDAPLRKDEG